MTLKELFEAQKTLDAPPKWNPDADPREASFTQTLSIGAATVGGLILRGIAVKAMPERDVIFQLEWFKSGRTSIRLARVEWNPLSGHVNDERCSPHLRLLQIEGSHLHDFYENYIEAEDRMRSGNIDAAIKIDTPLPRYEDLLDHCGRVFHIGNMPLVPYPPVETDLFRPQP